MKFLRYLIIGLGIGFACTTFFLVLFGGWNDLSAQLVAWLIASCIYGVSSMIFESEKLSTPLKSVIHFTISLAVTSVNTLLFYRGYALSIVLSFTIAYGVIFFVMWQIDRCQTKKINDKLQKR